MTIQVKCPGCGKVREVPEEWAGKTATCKDCKTPNKIPGIPSARDRSRSEIATQPPPVPGTADRPSSTREENVAEPPPFAVPPPIPDAVPPIPPDADIPPALPETRPADGATRTPAGSEIDGSTAVTIDQLLQGMSQAVSIRKIGFFLLGALSILLVCAVLFLLGVLLPMWTESTEPLLFIWFLAVVFVVGYSGVMAGGLAHMASEEGRGRNVGILAAARFCRGRFLPLFGGAILLALGLLIAGGMINGLILLLNKDPKVGSFVASMLFLPQFALNALLLIGFLVGVIVFCAIAVEGIGPIDGVRRLTTLAVRHTGSLVVSFAITLFTGLFLFVVLMFLVQIALGPTLLTNGMQMFSIPSVLTDREAFSGMSEQDAGRFSGWDTDDPGESPLAEAKPSGDWLRTLSVIFLYLALLSFPAVYWVCAFTRYYESMIPLLDSTGRPTGQL